MWHFVMLRKTRCSQVANKTQFHTTPSHFLKTTSIDAMWLPGNAATAAAPCVWFWFCLWNSSTKPIYFHELFRRHDDILVCLSTAEVDLELSAQRTRNNNQDSTHKYYEPLGSGGSGASWPTTSTTRREFQFQARTLRESAKCLSMTIYRAITAAAAAARPRMLLPRVFPPL